MTSPDAPPQTPSERYRTELERSGYDADAAQHVAVEALDALHSALSMRDAQRARSWFGRRKKMVPEQGLYLWGGVGRGKTFLMDLFFDCLPFPNKLRMHFHRFMQRVHRELTDLAGTTNPLQAVADRLAGEGRVLCFDEFFVSDIGDAMILGELLDALFARGVTLVATSNLPPDRLYENGLQRRRFLPAIALLEQHTRVLNMDGGVDYRLRVLEQAEIYHSPLDDEAERTLAESFQRLAPEVARDGVQLTVEGRQILARRLADDVVWFDFPCICDGPRSQNDYVELARVFHAVLISDVPRFDAKKEDQARRFISLVDEFYDRNVKLILSAEVPIVELYAGSRLRFEFDRTESRLLEMQSHDYLARSHRA